MVSSPVKTHWDPRTVAAHYGIPSDLDGAGQKIAIMDLGEPVDLDDLHHHFAQFGAPAPKLSTLAVDATAPLDPHPTGIGIETHIDVQTLGLLCPAAEIVIVQAKASLDSFAHGIVAAVEAGCDVLSISWAWRENQVSVGHQAETDRALDAAQTACMTVCAAAGDYGASTYFEDGTDAAGKPTRTITDAPDRLDHAQWPASSPLVLSCGGTQLMTGEPTTLGQGPLREVVWNNIANGGLATGGGISRLYDQPEWQAGLDLKWTADRLGTGRVFPDVAGMAAMDSWKFHVHHSPIPFNGGTSVVTPFFAAVVAKANQARAQAKGAPDRLGWINARLYACAVAQDLFVDVTDGNNRRGSGLAGYDAVPGFDACTGWGVPRGAALLDALISM